MRNRLATWGGMLTGLLALLSPAIGTLPASATPQLTIDWWFGDGYPAVAKVPILTLGFPSYIQDAAAYSQGQVTPSGFASFTSASTWTLDGTLDIDHPAGTIETATSLQTTYGSDTSSYSIGVLPGVEFSLPEVFYRVPMSSVAAGDGITGNSFDGASYITLAPGADQASVNFYNEVVNDLGATGFAAVGQVSPPVTYDFLGSLGYINAVTMTYTPIITTEQVLASADSVTSSLLGGGGMPGGITLDFVEGVETTGDITGSFDTFTTAEFEDLVPSLSEEIVALGVEFVGGGVQMWTVDFLGDASGTTAVTFTYDDSDFGTDFNESILRLVHVHDDGTMEIVSGPDVVVDPVSNTITFDIAGFSDFYLVAIPEPGTALLLAAGLAGLAAAGRRRSLH